MPNVEQDRLRLQKGGGSNWSWGWAPWLPYFNPLTSTWRLRSNGPMRWLVHWPLISALSHLVQQEGPGHAVAYPVRSSVLTVPNVTAHSSSTSVPTLWYSMWYHNYLFPLEPRRRVQLPSPLATISRISSLKVLGVTISSQMLISKHVFTVISSCAKSIYALRTLRSHGMNNEALHMICTSGAHPERMMSSLGKKS